MSTCRTATASTCAAGSGSSPPAPASRCSCCPSEQDVRTKVAGFDAGAVDYITKPFHRAEVMARVRTQLRLHAAHRAVIELQALKLAQLASAQQAMIPQPESLPAAGFRLYYRPLQEAGGDFCHVCAVGGSLHDYIVGDVCGHHVGTAMTTAALQALLRQNCSALYSPVEILNTVNRVARSMFADGEYVTAVYARVNRQTHRLTLANAGHPPAILQKCGWNHHRLVAGGRCRGRLRIARVRLPARWRSAPETACSC